MKSLWKTASTLEKILFFYWTADIIFTLTLSKHVNYWQIAFIGAMIWSIYVSVSSRQIIHLWKDLYEMNSHPFDRRSF